MLKGVNDDTDVMRELVHGLGRMGIRPYYLYYADLVRERVLSEQKYIKGKKYAETFVEALQVSFARFMS